MGEVIIYIYIYCIYIYCIYILYIYIVYILYIYIVYIYCMKRQRRETSREAPRRVYGIPLPFLDKTLGVIWDTNYPVLIELGPNVINPNFRHATS